MKFNSLKRVIGSVITLVMCYSIVACNNETGNDSTKAAGNENKTPDSAATTNPSANTAKKKTGKASLNTTAIADAKQKVEKDKMGYYNNTEVSPEYKGGQDALQTYISNNIEYPQDAIDNNVEGTVSVKFVVDEHGKVSNVKTVGNKIGYGLEEEVVKVVSQMPAWIPGQVKGKYVKTWRTLPVTYKLES